MSLDSKVAVVRGEKRLLNETKFFPAGNLQVGFPIYAVEYSAATSTLFVAGGGGPAKTGVRNSIVRLHFPFILLEILDYLQVFCQNS